MARKGTTSESVDADREQPPTIQTNARGKRAGRPKKAGASAACVRVPEVVDNTGADIEIAELKAQLAEAQWLQKEAEGRVAKIVPHRMHKEDDRQDITTIPKPKGEAGDKKNGFNLRAAMQLEDAEHKGIYDAIQRSIRTNAIRAGLDFTADYRRQDPAKLANVFKMTRKDHPYMTKKRFPADWSAAELLKQYLKNHRRHAVRNGRMESRVERKRREQDEANRGEASGHRNVDHDDSDPQPDDSDRN